MKFKKVFYQPFFFIGLWLIKRFLKLENAKYRNIERELTFVNGGNSDVQEYEAHRIAKALCILFWGVGFCILAELFAGSGQSDITELIRPSYGKGSVETELTVQVEGEEREAKVSFTVEERVYTEKEARELLAKVKDALPETVKGENPSLMEVRESLVFQASFENGMITAEWFVEPSDLLDKTGKIIGKPEETGTEAEILVNLKCQEWVEEYRFTVCVFPQIRTEQERFLEKVKDAVGEVNENTVSQEKLQLPEEVEGKKLRWKPVQESVTGILVVMVILTAICLAQTQDEKLKQQAREKRMGLLMEYPAFLYKLTALLRAGLTISASFQKIAENYKRDLQNPGYQKKYVCEEVLRCCNEIHSGVAQAQAYENFGRRCQLPEYIKLGSILSQNLKRGSKGLADMLEAEAMQGMEERRNMARKLGERAGSKLLFPMMLMLVIVMVILMVPAMMSFGSP